MMEMFNANLISFNVTCSLNGEYSAGMALSDKDNVYNSDVIRDNWTPIACTLETASQSIGADGVTSSDVAGSTQHIYGILESISASEGIIETTKSFKVKSFFSRLQNVPIFGFSSGSIKDTLTAVANDCGVPTDLYDFSAVPTQYTYSGLVKGENAIEEMRKLAQAALCYLFVNEQGKLVIEPWKEASSSVDYTIPSAFIISATKELLPRLPASLITVRGQNTYAADPPGHVSVGNQGNGAVTRSVQSAVKQAHSAQFDPKAGGIPNQNLSPGTTGIASDTSGSFVIAKTNATKLLYTPPELSGDRQTDHLSVTATANQGVYGRRIRVRCYPRASGTGETVSVRGQKITVQFQSSTSTLTSIASAINGNAAAAKQVSVTGAGSETVTKEFVFYLDDGAVPSSTADETEYKVEFTTVGYRRPEALEDEPARSGSLRSKDVRNEVANTDVFDDKNVGGAEVRRASFTGSVGGKLAGQESSKSTADEPDPVYVESSCGNCTTLTTSGIAREEITNEYIATSSQCDRICQRGIVEFELDRNAFKVGLSYNPNIKLNDVVQFTLPQTGATIRGPVVDLAINYATGPTAAMAITVQNVLALTEAVSGPSGNILIMPDLPYIGGVVWKTEYSSVFLSEYSASTIAFTSGSPCTITDSANGFVDAGFVAEQWVTVTGAIHAENVAHFQIASVAAGTLTLRTHDTLVAESAGNAITIRHFDGPPNEFDYVRAVRGILIFDLPNSVTRSCEQTVPTVSGKEYKLKFNAERVRGSTNLTVNHGSGSTTITPTENGKIMDYSLTHTATATTTVFKFQATGDCRWEISSPSVIRLD